MLKFLPAIRSAARASVFTLMVVLALGAGPQAKAQSVDGTDAPITVFVAKKFITMDPSWPVATAVAVQNGRIVSVGRDMDDLAPWLKNRPHSIDKTLQDKIVMPGFVEPHSHPFIAGVELNLPLVTHLPMPQPYGPDFPGVKDAEEGLALIARYVSEAKDPDQAVIIFGWDIVAMGRHLDKTVLDSISSTQPILVWDASAHNIYINSALIKKLKLTDDYLSVTGAQKGADGHLNGQFFSIASSGPILQKAAAHLFAPATAVARINSLLDMSVKGGITSTTEMMLGAISLDAEIAYYNKIFNAPDARTRLMAFVDANSVTAVKKAGAIDFVKSLQQSSTDYIAYNGVKFFSDDAFIGLTMAMDTPGYVDGHKGEFLTPPDVLFERMKPWWDAGFQIHIHSNGTAGNKSTLNALAALQAEHPRFDHRFTVEHFGNTTPDMPRQLARLGGQASVNPYYVYYRGLFNAAQLGVDRAYTAARFKDLLDAGVTTTMHSDTPMGPPRPLEWAWIAVNRMGINSDDILAPAERITVDQAMRMITIDAAFVNGQENRIGSIVAGKFADFAVLDQDPYDVPPMDLKDIHVWGTVLGGRIQRAEDVRPAPGLDFKTYDKKAGIGAPLTAKQLAALHKAPTLSRSDLQGPLKDYAEEVDEASHAIAATFRHIALAAGTAR